MELFHRQQGLDESLEDFALALDALAIEALLDNSAAANRSGVYAFVGELRNQVVGTFLIGQVFYDPPSAVVAARRASCLSLCAEARARLGAPSP